MTEKTPKGSPGSASYDLVSLAFQNNRITHERMDTLFAKHVRLHRTVTHLAYLVLALSIAVSVLLVWVATS